MSFKGPIESQIVGIVIARLWPLFSQSLRISRRPCVAPPYPSSQRQEVHRVRCAKELPPYLEGRTDGDG